MHLPAIPEPNTAISADQILRIEAQISKAIHKINDMKTLEECGARLRALEAYLRSKGLQRPALGAQRQLEARIGQLLGDGPDPRGRGIKSPHAGDIESQRKGEYRLLARGFNGANLKIEDWRRSRRAMVGYLRQLLGLIPPTPALPAGRYRCIVADPPWEMDTGPDVFSGTGEAGHDDLAYPTMTVKAVTEMKVSEHAADDSHLYLWTTNRYVEASYSVARAWGFKPSVLLVWAKSPRGVGLGDAYRLTTEFILYARRGQLKEMNITERTWFTWPRGKHSEKPDAFYEMVESMTPSTGTIKKPDRLDMFARKERKGWKSWGHEA